MITFFATLKEFRGSLGVTQTNAVRSWRRLSPRPEILLFGRGPGTERLAAETGAVCVPEVETNRFGTPYLSSLFERAQSLASFDILCFINGDIIVPENFAAAAAKIHSRFKERYLLVGRRSNLDWDQPLDFADPSAVRRFDAEARSSASSFVPQAMDYFVFPRGFYERIPKFIAGRLGYDGWLVWSARRRGRVIDGSSELFVIHQNHDYAHLHPEKPSRLLQKKAPLLDRLDAEGEEGTHNRAFLGRRRLRMLDIRHAGWKIERGIIRRKKAFPDLVRQAAALPRLYPVLGEIYYFCRRPFTLLRRKKNGR